ncbi:lys-63-specific deubiquitinase BRCC36-like isoform X2 [Hibiscus syriacus]|uniref:lys-63-specific deubiquitinase BRCC36-like isoform X2 n=1 Tax=Hibiscus syriacus TaxID=106335 RepID=UPI001924E3A7|nr:lys-63-specific deubiquitinase BRCC36-like isoform X2 [Hibiscus syriacus]
MSLTCVKISEDVWLTCLTHALSTETEEIMGLLLGDIEYSKDGNVTALIWGASPQSRSDRRKDRVETNPEQLAAASAQADRMTASTGRTTRVIGWYHSHPHITVLPSHVDVRTQAMYQLLDSGFVGLIFSCFSEDINKMGRIQVIAFQSSDGKQNNVSGPIALLSPLNRSSVIDLESSLSSENPLVTSGSAEADSHMQDTGDSRSIQESSKGGGRSVDLGGFFANADANYLGQEQGRGYYNTNNMKNAIVDIDPMDMSESMQEAMHRSNLDMSGAEYVRKEIPLHVLPTCSLINLDSPLKSFTDLQRVLYEEERAAYNQAILQNMRDGKVHPLSFIHHTSTYQASMCKLIEYCLSPAISALQDRLKENEIRLAMLTDEAKTLDTETSKGSGPSSPSTSHGFRGSTLVGQRDLHNSPESISTSTFAGTGSRSRKRS